MEQVLKKYIVSGMVQGVGYRFFALREAKKLGINGSARNLYDGNVEVIAIGIKENLDIYKELLLKGPQRAYVTKITEDNVSDISFEDFYIL